MTCNNIFSHMQAKHFCTLLDTIFALSTLFYAHFRSVGQMNQVFKWWW
jgi:hypothetical protein